MRHKYFLVESDRIYICVKMSRFDELRKKISEKNVKSKEMGESEAEMREFMDMQLRLRTSGILPATASEPRMYTEPDADRERLSTDSGDIVRADQPSVTPKLGNLHSMFIHGLNSIVPPVGGMPGSIADSPTASHDPDIFGPDAVAGPSEET